MTDRLSNKFWTEKPFFRQRMKLMKVTKSLQGNSFFFLKTLYAVLDTSRFFFQNKTDSSLKAGISKIHFGFVLFFQIKTFLCFYSLEKNGILSLWKVWQRKIKKYFMTFEKNLCGEKKNSADFYTCHKQKEKYFGVKICDNSVI